MEHPLLIREQNNFNLLRLIAAFMVIFTHSYVFSGQSEKDFITNITGGLIPALSRLGVMMFFIISGFLIANSLKNSKNVGSFLWKRFLRIFPGLFVCLVVVVFFFGPLFTSLPLYEYFSNSQTTHYFWGSLSLYDFQNKLPGVFQHNIYSGGVNGTLWTLRYEWTLYLFLALLILFIRKRPKLLLSGVLVIFFILCFAAGNGIVQIIPFLNLDLHDLATFGCLFFLGALGMELRHRIKFNFWIVLGSSIVVFGLMRNLEIAFYLKLIVLTYVTLWLATIRLPIRVSRWFSQTDFSYGFYIYACPIGQGLSTIFGRSIDGGLLALLTILCTAPFAVLSWYLVEKPMMRLKLVGVEVVEKEKPVVVEKASVEAT